MYMGLLIWGEGVPNVDKVFVSVYAITNRMTVGVEEVGPLCRLSPMMHVYYKEWLCCMSLSFSPNIAC